MHTLIGCCQLMHLILIYQVCSGITVKIFRVKAAACRIYNNNNNNNKIMPSRNDLLRPVFSLPVLVFTVCMQVNLYHFLGRYSRQFFPKGFDISCKLSSWDFGELDLIVKVTGV